MLKEKFEINKLKEFLGVEEYNAKQKKAIKNIKGCANNQWGLINSYYDGDESARVYFLHPNDLFNEIYKDSQEDVFEEGMVSFSMSSYLKDIRFCGKEFLQKVTFYYLVDILDEALPEIEATEEEIEKVSNELQGIYNRLFNIVENSLVRQLAELNGYKIKKTKKNEEWVSISLEDASKLREAFNTDDKATVVTSGKKITASYEDGREYVLNFGKNPYLWKIQ